MTRSPKPPPGPGRATVRRSAAALEPTAGLPLGDAEMTQLLLDPTREGQLKDYFGANQYEELRRLADEVAVRGVRGGHPVLILPGIMGSHLGTDRLLLDQAIWLNPLAIMAGELLDLKLTARPSRIKALGVIHFTYLSLKLRLALAGFAPEFYPFDWRRSVKELGAALARKIQSGPPIHIVAHSMGGLVARAALAHDMSNLRRIVMLGTPNYGSFSPVEAFRGTSSSAQKVAKLGGYRMADLVEMFASFPGLMQMLPARVENQDFFDLAQWPPGAVLDPAALAAARKVARELPIDFSPRPPGAADIQEIILIAGVNQPTKVAAQVSGAEFTYVVSNEGDGTVPLEFARIASARRTYFVQEEHGKLPGNRLIGEALPALLSTGQTTLLSETFQLRRSSRTLPEQQLADEAGSLAKQPMSVQQRRDLAAEFVAADDTPSPFAPLTALDMPPAGPVDLEETFSDGVIIGRERHRRLEITVAQGSIVEADAGCYVLGLFKYVRPVGPALEIDDLMGGAISELVARRMLTGEVGAVNILPKGRHPLRADNVAFVGLGDFDTFSEDVYEVVGENLVRTFAATRVDDFAMVPVGAGSKGISQYALRQLIKGFLRGLKEADPGRRFRGITICETDPERCRVIKDQLYNLCRGKLFDEAEVVLHEARLPPPRSGLRAAPVEQPTYVIVRQDFDAEDQLGFTTSVLTAGAKAAIVRGRASVPETKLAAFLQDLDGIAGRNLDVLGDRLSDLVLTDQVRQALAQNLDTPTVVVHDAGASRIPWELLRVGGDFPALRGGLSHRFEAENLAIAKWMTEHQSNSTMEVLLVVNPTGDLVEADREGARIEAILKSLGGFARTEVLARDEARQAAVLERLRSGRFDVVHYAGHAFFDPLDPSRSGILCADKRVISGPDLAGSSSLPSLMFFNACEAARVRKLDLGEAPAHVDRRDGVRGVVSFAEALLRGGVKNYVGTYWPVGDGAAKLFAEVFYGDLLGGRTVGEALKAARQKVKSGDGLQRGSNDWADYIHYGDPGFVLKTRNAGSP